MDPGLVKPRVRSLILTEFYRVFVSDFTGFPWLPSQHFRFYWVLPSFFSIGIGFYLVLPFLTRFLSSFTNLIKVLPSFTGFYLMLLGFTGFYLILLGLTGFFSNFTGFPWLPSPHFRFYWVLPSFFALDWVLPSFTVLFLG